MIFVCAVNLSSLWKNLDDAFHRRELYDVCVCDDFRWNLSENICTQRWDDRVRVKFLLLYFRLSWETVVVWLMCDFNLKSKIINACLVSKQPIICFTNLQFWEIFLFNFLRLIFLSWTNRKYLLLCLLEFYLDLKKCHKSIRWDVNSIWNTFSFVSFWVSSWKQFCFLKI